MARRTTSLARRSRSARTTPDAATTVPSVTAVPIAVVGAGLVGIFVLCVYFASPIPVAGLLSWERGVFIAVACCLVAVVMQLWHQRDVATHQRDVAMQQREHVYFSPFADVFTVSREDVAYASPLSNPFARSRLPSVYAGVLHTGWKERVIHERAKSLGSAGSPRSSSKTKKHCAPLFERGERAHLCCHSSQGDAIYERLVHMVLGGPRWNERKRASAYLGVWNKSKSRREVGTGMKHHVRNSIAVNSQALLMDGEPQVLILPVLDADGIRVWDGEPYDVVVVCLGPSTWGDISVRYNLCEEAHCSQVEKAVVTFNSFHRCAAQELSRSLGQNSVNLPNCEDDVVSTIQRAPRLPNGYRQLPCVFLQRSPIPVRVCLRKLGDGSETSRAPDPMLILFKSVSMLQHWSGFQRDNRKPFLPGCAEPEPVCSQCEASWALSEEIALMRDAEERKVLAVKHGFGATCAEFDARETIMQWDTWDCPIK